MDKIENGLIDGERIIHKTRLHWAMFFGPLMLFIIGILTLHSKGMQSMAIMAVSFCWGIIIYKNYQRTELTITNQRVLVNIGFILRRSYAIPFQEIDMIDFHQPSLGTMLNFGKILIVHRKSAKKVIRMVSAPAEFILSLKEQVTNYQRL